MGRHREGLAQGRGRGLPLTLQPVLGVDMVFKRKPWHAMKKTKPALA